MFNRFRLQRALRNNPAVDVLVIENVPASEVSAVIRHFEAQGWTHLRSEAMGQRRGETLYRLFFARERNAAASLRNEIVRRLFPPETPPSTL